MKDESVRKPAFADRSRRRFRSRMLRLTVRVKGLGLIMEMMEPGNIWIFGYVPQLILGYPE